MREGAARDSSAVDWPKRRDAWIFRSEPQGSLLRPQASFVNDATSSNRPTHVRKRARSADRIAAEDHQVRGLPWRHASAYARLAEPLRRVGRERGEDLAPT